MDNQELNMNELEQVTGGTVVTGNDGRFYAVDKLGCVLVSSNSLQGAIYGARMSGLSQEVIDEKQYEAKYGRKLDERWNPYA